MSGYGEMPVPVPYVESPLPNLSSRITNAMALYTVQGCVHRRFLGASLPADWLSSRHPAHIPIR